MSEYKYCWDDSMDQSLFGKIKTDLKKSMLNKAEVVRDTLRMIISEYPKLTIAITLESGKKTTRLKNEDEITNEDIQKIIRSLVKSEKTVLEIKNESTSEYLQILENYLPKMITEDEIKLWIEKNINFDSYNNPMQAMKDIMKHFGKSADGNLVKKILQSK